MVLGHVVTIRHSQCPKPLHQYHSTIGSDPLVYLLQSIPRFLCRSAVLDMRDLRIFNVKDSIAESSDFSLRIRIILKRQALKLLLPVAIEPSSFSIDCVREVVLFVVLLDGGVVVAVGSGMGVEVDIVDICFRYGFEDGECVV